MNHTEIGNMCGQVYHVMIQETMIHRNDKVIVYNILNSGILPVEVDHETFATMQYAPNDLKDLFIKVCQAPRVVGEKSMIIKAHIQGSKTQLLEMYEPPLSADMVAVIKAFSTLDPGHINLMPLIRVVTKKPITYL